MRVKKIEITCFQYYTQIQLLEIVFWMSVQFSHISQYVTHGLKMTVYQQLLWLRGRCKEPRSGKSSGCSIWPETTLQKVMYWKVHHDGTKSTVWRKCTAANVPKLHGRMSTRCPPSLSVLKNPIRNLLTFEFYTHNHFWSKDHEGFDVLFLCHTGRSHLVTDHS